MVRPVLLTPGFYHHPLDAGRGCQTTACSTGMPGNRLPTGGDVTRGLSGLCPGWRSYFPALAVGCDGGKRRRISQLLFACPFLWSFYQC